MYKQALNKYINVNGPIERGQEVVSTEEGLISHFPFPNTVHCRISALSYPLS